MTDESYYKYWALVALDDRDKGLSWGRIAFHDSMVSLSLQRWK